VGSAVKVLVAIHYSCQKLVHKKCSSIKGSMSKVAKSSDTRTTVRECCKGDDESVCDESIWEREKFDPPPKKNP